MQGSQGSQGTQGVQGLSNQGVQGSQGTQGVQGLSNQGVQGSQGTLGSQGLQGTQGVQGDGIQGFQGSQGLQGTQGVQGLSNQGVQGSQGLNGANDASITILNDTTTNSNWYVGILSVTSGIARTAHVSSTKLYFNPSTGQLTATDFNSSSDIRLKTDLQKISDPLSKVLQLNGYEFKWKQTNKSSIGIIAQELEKVLPQLVNGSDSKSVNYNGIIAILIESIKELDQKVEDLTEEVRSLRMTG